ncbi:MAG: NAD(P)/FAD-dependent oxidoreductase [Halobacteriota archaeon]
MTDHQVAVVGAGLAGLETARLLAEADRDVVVYEANSTVGGRVRTDERDGYTLDRGFQVLFTAYPEARRALDFDELDLKRFPPGAIICRANHRGVVADPLRDPVGGLETALSTDLSIGDKIRILRLRQALSARSRDDIYAGTDESIESLLDRLGFSERFVDSFARPFYGGITLDRSLATSARVFEFTFKMLASGAAAIPAAGMQAIPEQLARRARDHGAVIETNTPVETIDGTGPVTLEVDGESITADTAVVAAGPRASHSLTGIDAIPTQGRGVLTQYFSLPAGNPIGEQARIHLHADGDAPNQVVNLSAVAPSYAPDDEILLSASTPGQPEVDHETLAEDTRRALQSWYPAASFEALELLDSVQVPFAQFGQPPGIHESLPSVTAPAGAVYLAGDFTEDSSINGALRSGRHAAAAVLDSS